MSTNPKSISNDSNQLQNNKNITLTNPQKKMGLENGIIEESENNNGGNGGSSTNGHSKTLSYNEIETNQNITSFVNGNLNGFEQQEMGISSQKKDSMIDRSNYPPDLLRILDNIQNPQELIKLFETYIPKSHLIPKENLIKMENVKIKRYKDCVYFGQINNNKRDGLGIMIYSNGKLYEGYWENEMKHGEGFELYPSGNKYIGDFINGKPDGMGTFSWCNGELYEGEWKDGFKHGSGMWRGIRGDSYMGEWKRDKADGYGVHIWKNGDRYEGEFKSFLKHGQGTEKFANGDYYVGTYINGKPDGYGEYYWINGSQYKGQFKNGLRHGKGIWKKGQNQADKYDGEWVNDKKSGYGIFSWASGNYYKGNYFDDLRHGYGEMYWIDGSIYKGNWDKGIQHGEGELIIPGENPKIGLFKDNIFIGETKHDSNLEEDSLNITNKKSKYHQNDHSSRIESSDQGIEDTKKLYSTQKKTFHVPSSDINVSEMDDIQENTQASFGKNTKDFDNSFQPESTNPIFYTTTYTHKKGGKESLLATQQHRISNFHITGGVGGEDLGSLIQMPYIDTDYKKKNIIKKLSPQRTKGRESNKTTPNQHTKFTNNSMDSRKNPNIGISSLLTYKELVKWNQVKDKLNLNVDKFKNLDDPEVCTRIRAIINPPVWRDWAN